jgi:NTE family protein
MRVALALGSGGARGYAHIGVIDELKARGHEIVGIAGTSMGALVGGLEAAGALGDYSEWVRGLSQADVIRLLDPAFGEPGVIKAQRVIQRVADLLGDACIENLPIPYTAVATDLTNQREVWFQHGPLHMAIRASIAIPSAITPVMLEGRLLADGGLLNPVPMDPLAGVVSDFTLAVSLSGRRESVPSTQPSRESSLEVSGPEWVDALKKGAADVLDSDLVRAIAQWWSKFHGEPDHRPDDAPGFDEVPRELKTTDVVALSMDAASALIGRFRMAANPPDVMVTVPIDSATVFDFHKAGELIELGRRLAVDALDAAGR